MYLINDGHHEEHQVFENPSLNLALFYRDNLNS